MISLYPSHIHISFPYSHILPYPYISHIHVFIFLSVPPVALPLVFFSFFHFCGVGTGCVFLVVFLVSVLWMVFVPSFALLLVSPFASFRRSPRPVVSPFGPFPSVCLFVPSLCSFLRFGVSGGRFVGRAVFVGFLGLAGVCVFFRVLVPWRRCGGMLYR